MAVIKPQSPFENLKKSGGSSEEKLIKAIIMQNLIDASNTNFQNKNRQIALSWFYTKEFQIYCSLLNQDHNDVLSKIFQMISEFLKSKKKY